MGALRLLGSALAKFWRDEGLFLASGIAFQVLLSLVPITLLVLSSAGSYFFSHDQVMEQFGHYLEKAAPALDERLRTSLIEIVDHRGTTGLVGTAGLLWIATTVFGSLRMALDTIFGVSRARSTLWGLGLDVAMIAVCGASFFVSVGLTGAMQYLQRVPALLPGARERLLGVGLAYVVPFLLTLLICFLIYFFVPDRRGSARASFEGAAFACVLWEGAKHLFTWYVAAFGSYSLVYGPLSAAAVLLVWTYYSTAVLLLGAEVTALLEKSRAAQPPASPPTPGRSLPTRG